MNRFVLGILLALGIYIGIFLDSSHALSCDPEFPNYCYSAWGITIKGDLKHYPGEPFGIFEGCPIVKLDCSNVQDKITLAKTQIAFVIILSTLGILIILGVTIFLTLRNKYERLQLFYDRFVRSNQIILIICILSMLIFISVALYETLHILSNIH